MKYLIIILFTLSAGYGLSRILKKLAVGMSTNEKDWTNGFMYGTLFATLICGFLYIIHKTTGYDIFTALF